MNTHSRRLGLLFDPEHVFCVPSTHYPWTFDTTPFITLGEPWNRLQSLELHNAWLDVPTREWLDTRCNPDPIVITYRYSEESFMAQDLAFELSWQGRQGGRKTLAETSRAVVYISLETGKMIDLLRESLAEGPGDPGAEQTAWDVLRFKLYRNESALNLIQVRPGPSSLLRLPPQTTTAASRLELGRQDLTGRRLGENETYFRSSLIQRRRSDGPVSSFSRFNVRYEDEGEPGGWDLEPGLRVYLQ